MFFLTLIGNTRAGIALCGSLLMYGGVLLIEGSASKIYEFLRFFFFISFINWKNVKIWGVASWFSPWGIWGCRRLSLLLARSLALLIWKWNLTSGLPVNKRLLGSAALIFWHAGPCNKTSPWAMSGLPPLYHWSNATPVALPFFLSRFPPWIPAN